MPAGRPRLKPEVKAQHVQESRKRYEDQNADKRREAARLRMQWYTYPLPILQPPLNPCSKRAAIAASDFHTRRKYREKVAVNSEIYRARKRQEEVEQNCAAAAVKQKKRGLELDELHKKRLAVPRKAPSPAILAPTAGKRQRLRAPRLPSPAMPPPAPVMDAAAAGKRTRPRLLDLLSVASDSGPDEDQLPVWPVCIPASRDRLAHQYPHAFIFEAPTWGALLRRWFLECEEFHWHPENQWSPFTPLSTAPSSPLTLTTSTPSRTPSPPALADDARIAAVDAALEKPPSATPQAPPPSKLSLRERQAQRNAKYNNYLEAEDARLAADAAAQKKEELMYLASTRGSASPERMRQQFARVLGPVSVLEWPPPGPSDSLVAQGLGGEPDPVLLNPLGQTQTCHQRLAMPAALPTENCDREGVEQGWGEAPVMYAVSGRNRVFRDRERAMAALKESPGAELVFTRNEVELFQFLEDFDKKFKI
ncbi:hypothetical protein DFH07DRAFT_782845 [Mycena maculata]|uniref:Uncharacterized protein n=1 Tax=Mycena maculata TaxID=230809 RepID=A0AAD7MQ62_9AGAR|nr:hypothetical protein DFH07DRAFT_782845 [Mycena maculata]